MRSTRLFLVAAAAAAAFASFARADDASVARVVAGSEAEATGDFDKWLEELVGAVEADPKSPYAMAALSKIQALMGSAKDPGLVERKLAPVLTTGVMDGEIDEKLRDVLSERARARGDFDAAAALAAEKGYVRQFAAVGPFGWGDAALVHRRYAPEARDLDLAAPLEGRMGPVRWLALPVVGHSPWISPSDQLRPGGSAVFYALARLKSAKARTVAVKVSCRASFAVFVNGVEVLLADRVRDDVPDDAWASAHLEEGWNRLVVKVAGDSPFAIKLCDPTTGLPAADITEEAPLGGAEIGTPGTSAQPRVYRTPYERAAALAASDASAATATAYLAGDEGRRWEAYTAYLRAAAAAPSDGPVGGDVHAACGRFLASFDRLPAVSRKLRATDEFMAAVKAFPRHNSAAVRLAEYENEDDHPDKAVKSLRDQIAARPTATAWMALARIAKQRNWEREAIDAAQQALKLAPNNVEAILFLLDFDRRYGNAAAAAAKTKRLLAIDADDGRAVGDQLAQLRAQGRHDDALALAKSMTARHPDNLWWRRQVPQLLSALGRDDEALAAWKELAAFVPLEAAWPRQIGQLLETNGEKAAAAEAYKKSLALEPFQPALWRDLARLEGTDGDFGAPYEPNVEEVLAKLPSTEELKKKYPKAVAVTVLDHCVTRIREGGAAQSYVHMLYKILDEKGVKKYGDQPNRGELLEVRAILPDGRVMAPSGIPGQNYNMEGLVPGAVVELRYLENARPGPHGYEGSLFYFQDADFGDEPNPVLHSRFVLIAPTSMKLDPVKRNYEGEPSVETKDGATTTIWEKRELPRVEPEKYMPEADEIVANVDYSRPEDESDANWRFLGARDDVRPTPILAEAVARVVKDGMSDMDKLRALYDFVNDEITGTSGGRDGPSSILLEKSGDRGQLFHALVRQAGIACSDGRAMEWNGAGVSRRRNDSAGNRFRQEFLWIEPKGAPAFPFFMLSRFAPFGIVPQEYRGSQAFFVDEKGGRIGLLPEGGAPTWDFTRFDIALGADEKSAKIAGTVAYRSAQDYEAKRAVLDWSQDDRKKWAERTFAGYFASPTLERYETPGLAQRGVPFEVRLEGSMAGYLSAQGGAYVAALGLPKMSMTQRFVDRQERSYDLVIDERDDRFDEFTVSLGGFRVKSLPQSHVVAGRLGTYSLAWRDEGDRVVVRREAHLVPARYRADEYKEFMAWCKAIDDAEERKLELVKAPQETR